MSVAELWATFGTIDWQAMVTCFLISIICDAWGKQWHMAGLVTCWLLFLAGYEIWCVRQTHHTMSQWQVIWQTQSVRDYWLSWIGQYAKVSAMIFFMLHMK